MRDAPSISITGSVSIDGQMIFRDLSLQVPAGQWTCLLGASGVGKSTVLRLVAGLCDGMEFDGRITADGQSPEGHCALMAQDDLLMPWLTALENTLLGARLRGQQPDTQRALEILARVGLSDKSARKPSELSGGQRQRVALARTLMEDRPIVLLDEPFSALDARTRAMMQELAAEVFAGRTVLLVTHDPAEAARLGNVIKLMASDSLADVTPPKGRVPRPFDDPEVLQVQAQLLARLRDET